MNSDVRWTCSKCGSDKVQLAVWYKPKTGEVGEPVFDHPVPSITVFWCDDCEEEHPLDAAVVEPKPFDFEQLRSHANTWARANVGCSVELVGVKDGVATFRMVDDDGEETSSVTVRHAGAFLGRQMLEITDQDGGVLVEAFGDALARALYV